LKNVDDGSTTSQWVPAMPIRNSKVLQILPQLPGTLDGVGDYALNLAKAVWAEHGVMTVFAVAQETTVASKDGFQVISGLNERSVHSMAGECDHVILHYVNYGYQVRGIPFHLRRFARQLRRKLRGRWLTTFHELYASGPPWKSEFWLRPLQVKIARDMVDISDACFVSNKTVENEIQAYDSAKKIYLAPVLSNFGEPELTDFTGSSPKQWAICGGTALVARSLLSFQQIQHAIPAAYVPEQLQVIGGRDDRGTRALVESLNNGTRGLACTYHPEVSVERASELLRDCSFAWLDYFGTGKIWPGMILKSGAFAACCAHAVVPVLSHQEGTFAVDGAAFPGPYFIAPGAVNFPPLDSLQAIRGKIYAWYQAHASSPRLSRIYAEALA
jgi:hypothetical protein